MDVMHWAYIGFQTPTIIEVGRLYTLSAWGGQYTIIVNGLA